MEGVFEAPHFSREVSRGFSVAHFGALAFGLGLQRIAEQEHHAMDWVWVVSLPLLAPFPVTHVPHETHHVLHHVLHHASPHEEGQALESSLAQHGKTNTHSEAKLLFAAAKFASEMKMRNSPKTPHLTERLADLPAVAQADARFEDRSFQVRSVACRYTPDSFFVTFLELCYPLMGACSREE